MRRALDRSPPPHLSDRILAAGGTIPGGWVLEDIVGRDRDGSTFVGNARNPASIPRAFRVELPEAP